MAIKNISKLIPLFAWIICSILAFVVHNTFIQLISFNLVFVTFSLISSLCFFMGSILILSNCFIMGRSLIVFQFILFTLVWFFYSFPIEMSLSNKLLFLDFTNCTLQSILLKLLFSPKFSFPKMTKSEAYAYTFKKHDSEDLLPVELQPTPVKIVNVENNIVVQNGVNPWLRFCARTFDYCLLAFIFVYLLSNTITKNKLPFTILMMFIWIFVETILLSTWGTTLGKWLFNIHVLNNEGRKPSFSQALKRSILVWFRGMGCCLPFIVLITHIVSYRLLKKNGVTSWDQDCYLNVEHTKLGIIKKIMCILFLFCYLFFPPHWY